MKMTTRHTYVNVNGKVVPRGQAAAAAGGAIPASTPLPPQGTPLLATRPAPHLGSGQHDQFHLHRDEMLQRQQEQQQQQQQQGNQLQQLDQFHLPRDQLREQLQTHEDMLQQQQPVLTMEPRDEQEEDGLEEGGGRRMPSVVQVMEPLVVSLKCYGLVLRERDGRRAQLCTIYCACVVTLLWFNALRYFAAYTQPDAHGTQLFVRVVIHIWNVQCALSVTVFVLVSHRSTRPFTALWADYKRRHGGVPPDKMRAFARRVAMSVNALMLSFAIVGVALFSLQLPALTSAFLVPLRMPPGGAVPAWAAAVYFTFHHYIAFCWIQPNIVLVILCVLLKKEFQEFASNFRATLVTPDTRGRPHCGAVSDIEGNRQRHLLLCKVSDALDDMFSLFNLLTFLFDIPTICAFIFVMIKNEELFAQDALALTASVAFFVIALTHVVSVTVAGASLCAAGKVPKSIIHNVDLRACTTQEGISVQVFLNRVTTEHIGLTAWKLVRIDRTLLIMVFGLILSYVVVLFKFALVATAQTEEPPAVTASIFRNATEYTADYR